MTRQNRRQFLATSSAAALAAGLSPRLLRAQSPNELSAPFGNASGGGHVVELSLADNALSGTLPPQLGQVHLEAALVPHVEQRLG